MYNCSSAGKKRKNIYFLQPCVMWLHFFFLLLKERIPCRIHYEENHANLKNMIKNSLSFNLPSSYKLPDFLQQHIFFFFKERIPLSPLEPCPSIMSPQLLGIPLNEWGTKRTPHRPAGLLLRQTCRIVILDLKKKEKVQTKIEQACLSYFDFEKTNNKKTHKEDATPACWTVA